MDPKAIAEVLRNPRGFNSLDPVDPALGTALGHRTTTTNTDGSKGEEETQKVSATAEDKSADAMEIEGGNSAGSQEEGEASDKEPALRTSPWQMAGKAGGRGKTASGIAIPPRTPSKRGGRGALGGQAVTFLTGGRGATNNR